MTGDFTDAVKTALQEKYLALINQSLLATFTEPVRFNHCFARIILDWTFGDCWYKHLNKSSPAYKQLSEVQLQAAIRRMKQWLADPQLLIEDNRRSLHDRLKRPAAWRSKR